MANELRLLFRSQYWRDSVMTRQSGQVETTVTTSSELYSENTQLVGTAHDAVDVGDISDNAMLIIENLDDTATIEVGGDDTGAFVSWFTIPPGYGPCYFGRATSLASVYLKSDTASTPVRVTLMKLTA